MGHGPWAMGHGLGAALLAASIVTPSGWIQTPAGYPHNYHEELPVIFNGVYVFKNTGSTTVEHNVGGQHSVPRVVSGSALEGPPATSGPTWGAKFTPLFDEDLVTNWEVSWTVNPGAEHFVNMIYSHEVGTETWWRNGQSAVRGRSWHTFIEQTTSVIEPGGGGQGGGG
ncbi:MAG: hypothetical protein AB7F50_11620 [Fimbriimonadaceae bacterium]